MTVNVNEQTIVKTINDTQDKGWELFTITSDTLNTDIKRQQLFIQDICSEEHVSKTQQINLYIKMKY